MTRIIISDCYHNESQDRKIIKTDKSFFQARRLCAQENH